MEVSAIFSNISASTARLLESFSVSGRRMASRDAWGPHVDSVLTLGYNLVRSSGQWKYPALVRLWRSRASSTASPPTCCTLEHAGRRTGVKEPALQDHSMLERLDKQLRLDLWATETPLCKYVTRGPACLLVSTSSCQSDRLSIYTYRENLQWEHLCQESKRKEPNQQTWPYWPRLKQETLKSLANFSLSFSC